MSSPLCYRKPENVCYIT